jgi:diguanylate cyclase (GGDEF)-like protein
MLILLSSEEKNIELEPYQNIISGFIFKPVQRINLYQTMVNALLPIKNHETLSNKPITDSRNPKVLIIDDEPLNLKLLENTLKNDYNIMILQSSKDTVETAIIFNPDIILLDIMMPEIDGYEICKHLNEVSETKDIPIIFLTALKDEQSEAFALELGVVDYIMKPFNLSILKARIKNHVQNKKARDAEKEKNTIDELTKIPNRRKFNEVLENELSRSLHNNSALSLLMLDIDFFKKYNDFYGHVEGDRCLFMLSQKLSRELKRPGDIMARWGGEEFACILPETDFEGAKHIAAKLLLAMEDLKIPHESSPISSHVTVSIGIALFNPKDPKSINDLVREADNNLYKAKP